MSNERKERCETCRFWDFRSDGKGGGDCDPLKNTDTPWGFCRRYPPTAILEDLYDGYHSFNLPIMSPEDWCGEWKPKPEDKR